MTRQVEHKITGITVTVTMDGKQYAMAVPQERADQAARDIAMLHNSGVMELEEIKTEGAK